MLSFGREAELVAEGRRAEADEQLRPARSTVRVGATRYVREGEALLAASA